MDDAASDDGSGVPAGLDAREVLNRIADPFFVVDEGWHLTYLNRPGRRALEALIDPDGPVEHPIGESLWDLVPAADGTTFQDRLVGAAADGQPASFEVHCERADRWFEVDAHPASSGIYAFFRDVTPRKRLVAERERREAVLREIYAVIAEKDATLAEKVDTLLSIGESVLDLEYAALSHVEGEEYVFEVVHDPDDATLAGDAVPLDQTNCERAILEAETLVLADIAEEAPELASRPGNVQAGLECYIGTPVVVDEAVYGTFCFYGREARPEPFTEWEVTLVELMGNWVSYELEREAQAAALARERNRLDEFAGVISHDLRSPLNVAQLSVELAAEEGSSEHLESAASALDRIEELIDDVLDFARSGAAVVDREAVPLDRTARSAWATVGADRATLELGEDLGVLEADRSRVQQLLENLFRNAAEHAGPDVTVQVGELPNRAGFYVADDGPGIPESAREDVLRSGYSTGERGTGFGLSIVEAIASAHGWELRIAESAEGGARFEFHGASLDPSS